jgi:hypothetical protein
LAVVVGGSGYASIYSTKTTTVIVDEEKEDVLTASVFLLSRLKKSATPPKLRIEEQ